ncbi:MAG TPA: thioredoxin-dependent thiol peroxidase [Gemmatimonadaceae bacterium]|nr:thioredoxin-dependent thiol peroxidase [Gemmatimonadaceae bacterium]
MTPVVGKPAPDFSLKAHDGKTIKLRELRGTTVVLYFYPQDDTEGCTKEACDFRDAMPRFKRTKALILGVSPDSVESHVKFREKYDLPFTLLADIDQTVCKAYGVWQKKKMFGREYMGVVRTTFIIDGAGVVRHIFKVKRVAGHVDDVDAAVRTLVG